MAAAVLLERIIVATDFSVAFMRTPVKEDAEIYVEMPPECGMGCGFVRKLRGSLYGLKKAALRFQIPGAYRGWPWLRGVQGRARHLPP
eukprot:6678761-Pyramimonas_sp.AAC.1